jgi:molecular chaperone GrpE
VIRDKRKVSPAGSEDKPEATVPTESQESNGSEAAASEPEAPAEDSTAGQADTASGDNAPEDKAPADKAKHAEPAQEQETEQPEPAASEAEPTIDSAELGALRSALDERTADLQRITAEYANYRKRVERDRSAAGELAVGMVLSELLAVLDDIDRARDHGDLTGPFAAVSDKLVTVTSKFGLTAFGAKGDAFDPNRHEAVAHQTSSEVTEPTCIEIMRRGYLLGERLLRPALVAVADPESE